MEQHYYKFRSLQNFKRFIDIILNKRLYASRYDELNDPMEGAYLINPSNRNIIRLLKERKYNTRICSLSKDYKHTLLWSHYADCHSGCCFEISVINEKERPTEVCYTDTLPIVDELKQGKDLLSHKSSVWRYEDEVRFFRKTSYLNVQIHRIIFGIKVSKDDYNFYKKLINALNPYIVVSKIKEEDIEFGFR